MDVNRSYDLDETEIAQQAALERFKVFNERAITGAYGALLGIALVGWVLFQAVGWRLALLWSGIIGSVELAIGLNAWRVRCLCTANEDTTGRLHWHLVLAGLAGAAWGSVVFFVWVGENLMTYLATLTILVGVAGVAMVTLSSYAAAAAAFFTCIYLLPLSHELMYPKPFSAQVGVGLVTALVLHLWYARELGKIVVREAAHSARNQALADCLHKLVTHDQLTGAFSRGYLFEQLERQLALRQRHNTAGSIVMFDLDHFKRINDAYGHPVGDRALREAVSAVAAQLREGDVLARVGGEEFLILLPMTDIHAASQLAERLRQTLASASVTEGNDTVHLPASFGVAELRDGETTGNWLQRVDKALYQAKADGRNRVAIAP